MELNKCVRCGCFFVSSGSICPNCAQKDSAEISKLENYTQEFSYPSNLEEISGNTGISVQSLARHFKENPQFNKMFKFN